MKILRIVAAILLSVSLWGCAASKLSNPPSVKQVWQTPKELKVPESVMYDPANKVFYVSNIGGAPSEKNHKGFISQLNLDGTIKNLKWVTDLNAPKGMGIFEGTLYVTDIDRVHAIEIASGAIKKSWDVKDAQFLNDIAIDKKGTVYISDTFAKAIYAIENGKLELFVTLQQSGPNGMLMLGELVLVGTNEGLCSLDPASKTVTLLIAQTGGIDGLKPLGDGRYIVSDWKGKTQIIEKDKPPIVLIDTTPQQINAADLEFIPEKNLLFIPTFFDNRVVAYQLK